MNRKLSVSMMCVDYGNINETLSIFENVGVDYLHIDVMDGKFVPNLMLGTEYVKWLRRMSDIPLDIHLMVDEPIDKLEWFGIQESDIVSIHVEADGNVIETLKHIKKYNAKAVIAINPETTVESVEHLLEYADGIMIMMVTPGFSGQAMINGIDKKIMDVVNYKIKKDSKLFIEVDGHVCEDNISYLNSMGAEIFVAGTSLLSKDKSNYEKQIHKFYEIR
jgi:ribulose-phosphate 3-epimerase